MSSRIASRGIFLVPVFVFFTVALSDSLSPQAPGAEVADLREQLEDGLKARRPLEFRFIARVVTLVDTNRLPLPLVLGTFQWARRRAGLNKYPYPYFEWALRIRAARIGVRL
ncbi:MAG: hypothetical protein ACC628_23270 [Pirellulaceae bacterium]